MNTEAKRKQQERDGDAGIHGCVLDGADVRRIREALAMLSEESVNAEATSIAARHPSLANPEWRHSVIMGVYVAVAERVAMRIKRTIDGADLSCAACPTDCMEPRDLCTACGAEPQQAGDVRCVHCEEHDAEQLRARLAAEDAAFCAEQDAREALLKGES